MLWECPLCYCTIITFDLGLFLPLYDFAQILHVPAFTKIIFPVFWFTFAIFLFDVYHRAFLLSQLIFVVFTVALILVLALNRCFTKFYTFFFCSFCRCHSPRTFFLNNFFLRFFVSCNFVIVCFS